MAEAAKAISRALVATISGRFRLPKGLCPSLKLWQLVVLDPRHDDTYKQSPRIEVLEVAMVEEAKVTPLAVVANLDGRLRYHLLVHLCSGAYLF
jgi:hypothetical protein